MERQTRRSERLGLSASTTLRGTARRTAQSFTTVRLTASPSRLGAGSREIFPGVPHPATENPTSTWSTAVAGSVCGAVPHGPCGVGEHEAICAVAVAGQVGGKGGAHDFWDGHDAKASLALRRPEHRDPIPDRSELAVDPDGTTEEVDPVDRQPEALALAEAHPGGEDDQGPVPRGYGRR